MTLEKTHHLTQTEECDCNIVIVVKHSFACYSHVFGQEKIERCTGFSLDRVNFLHNSSCGAMFWIGDQNSVGNTTTF